MTNKSDFFSDKSLESFKFTHNQLNSIDQHAIQKAIQEGQKEVHQHTHVILQKKDMEYVQKLITDCGFEHISSDYHTANKASESFARTLEIDVFYNKEKDSYLERSFFAYDYKSFTMHFSGPKSFIDSIFSKIKENCAGYVSSPEGTIYALTINTQGRMVISEFGQNGVKAERDNYNPEVIEGYDYVVQQMNANEPDGRIVIFDGKPGTGKTFLIRSLLVDIEEASIIIIPANVVAQAGTPELLTTLINHKTDYGDKMVLIVEDADQVVTKRAGDNISAVSTLLNLGDGILGSVLDIRIICTTNALASDLDDAITRPGRMCKHLPVPELTIEQAAKVYSRLTEGKAFKHSKKVTLAEVYKMAKDDKFVPKTTKGKVGFGE